MSSNHMAIGATNLAPNNFETLVDLNPFHDLAATDLAFSTLSGIDLDNTSIGLVLRSTLGAAPLAGVETPFNL